MRKWLNEQFKDSGEATALQQFRDYEGPNVGVDELNGSDEDLIAIGRRNFVKTAAGWTALAAVTIGFGLSVEHQRHVNESQAHQQQITHSQPTK